MYKELYKLLKEYKGQELNDDFIEIAFSILSEEEEITPYARDLDICETNSLGEYDKEKRVVIINKKGIINSEPKNGLSFGIDKKILALEVLKHEIEHAKQLQRFYTFGDDIETRVIGYSLRDYALNHGLAHPTSFAEIDPFFTRAKKRENYLIDPGERLAEIRGWEFIIDLIKNSKTSRDLLYARNMLYYSYVRGYMNNGYLSSPTYEFLLALTLNKEYYKLKEVVNEGCYPFDTRVELGLPITQDEYNFEVLKKVKTK